MIYGSVCSGIEAATVAWHGLGWKASFFSEIEKFPRTVLAHHYPDVPCHGDFTTIKENDYDAIDLLVGGTPCQAFSVAGLRKGLADERGNLTLEFVRLAERLNPRWVLWENVPGVLSIDGGRAFGSFLGGLAELGYGFAYRILDAQYFGVPQRRRRVFVVGYLGDWRAAAAVLFERESLCRDITPRREAREDIAGAIGARSCRSIGAQDAQCGHLIQSEMTVGGGNARTLTTKTRMDAETETLIPCRGGFFDDVPICFEANMSLQQPSIDGVHPTLTRRHHASVAYGIQGNCIGRLPENGGNGTGYSEDIAPTLTKTDQHGVMTNMSVRRLTPIECERLQGFPDGYTDINAAGGGRTPDGPRYKALGNSMAVPVMRWIGQRIQMVEEFLK
jgi:DNA (cytosine-5)-methyltransferase 1